MLTETEAMDLAEKMAAEMGEDWSPAVTVDEWKYNCPQIVNKNRIWYITRYGDIYCAQISCCDKSLHSAWGAEYDKDPKVAMEGILSSVRARARQCEASVNGKPW